MPSVDNATSGYAPVMCDAIDRFIFDLLQGCGTSAAHLVGQRPTTGSPAALVRSAICGGAARALFKTARQSRQLRTSSALTAAIWTTIKFDNPSIATVPDRGISPATLIQKLKSGISVFCPLIVGLLPLGASAQITEPLLPLIPGGAVFTAPTAPQNAATEPESGGYPGETVTSRFRPEFSASGVRFGEFYWFPTAELDGSYNSNIFATTTAPSSDWITTLAPSFALTSIFPRATLNLSGSAALQEYATHSSQNTQSGTFSVNGAYPVSAGGTISGNAQVSHPYIAYGSPTSPSATTIAEPVTYWNYTASTGYQQSGRRFSYGVNLAVNAAQYNAAPLVGGGVSPQSSQNAIIPDVSVNAGYEIAPDYQGFVRIDGSRYSYLRSTAASFTTYSANFGLRISPRHLIFGNVYAGYLFQNSGQSTIGSSFPDYGGELVWTVTTLTTLTFDGVRTFYTGTPAVNGTLTIGAAGNGYLASTVGARADHELLRNLLLTLNATYENDNFQGITRTDSVLSATAGCTYFVNRLLFLGGSFSYYKRISTAAGSSYNQNVVSLRLGTQF
jgi:hypothetical protein